MARLWRDDGGTVGGADWLVVATILVLGTSTALYALRQALLGQ